VVDKEGRLPIEKQYSKYFENRDLNGNEVLGSMATNRWRSDSKLLGVTLSRYKFVSKMFVNLDSVLEIGAADAWYSRVVFNEVKKLTLTDFDSIWLEDFYRHEIYRESTAQYLIHNFVNSPLLNFYDGIYGLDVLEHISPEDQDSFLSNVCASLAPHGIAIFGMPSIESQTYASEASKEGHVNCQSGNELRDNLKKHFQNVFIFSMSDEVVHTGFMPMAHYLLALCTQPLPEISHI
jgi:hypothetical protein